MHEMIGGTHVDVFEDVEKEIDVEMLMEQVKKKINDKKGNRGLEGVDVDPELKRSLEYINFNWDIKNSTYNIRSHRPLIGTTLVKGRKLVHGEVRRYVDPSTFKQSEFNSNAINVLNKIVDRLGDLASRLDRFDGRLDEFERILHEGIDIAQEGLRQEIDIAQAGLREEISRELKDAMINIQASVDDHGKNNAWLIRLLDHQTKTYEIPVSTAPDVKSLNYFVFEERFRGDRRDIKNRQSVFLDYFESCKNVLDIGCGRGEFLELLKEAGIVAQGIDIDENMIEYCRSKGLDVLNSDAIKYLEGLEDKSLDGLFLDQVVEHLDPVYLINLLELCFKKLKYGYYIVIETVNPLSFISFSNFYIDLTHKRPIHPETLNFLLISSGFREIDKKFYSPLPDEAKLARMTMVDGMSDAEERLMETYNKNIDMLNNILYGPQDYAIVGKK